MKRFIAVLTLAASALMAQQPQTQTAPIYRANAKYVQGVGPGYWPTAGSGLILNVAAGTAFCSGSIITFAGGTLTMTASATDYVYLNTGSSCVPAVKTTAFAASDIPIATVIAGSSAITSIADDRTMFQQSSSGAGVGVPNLIYDDDCTSDPDCAVNLMPLLARLVQTNQVNLLALINDSSNAYAAPAMHILASFYGMGEVPLGAWLGAVPSSNTTGNVSIFTQPLVTQFNPGDIDTNYPGCVTIYRTTLAAAPDHSVKIASTGFLTCIDALMQSPADGISSLAGPQLIQAKVIELDVMGGSYPSGSEFNLTQDSVSSSYVSANWTSENGYPPIYFSGFNSGAASVSTGIPSSYPTTDPSAFVGSLTSFARPSWDALTLYQAIYGYSGLSAVSADGTNTVNSTGVNTFSTSTASGHFYLTLSQSSAYYKYLLNAAQAAQGSDGVKVSTVNGLAGDVTIAGGSGTEVVVTGKTVTVSVIAAGLSSQPADTILMNASGGAAVPSAVGMPIGCTAGTNYSTITHTWTCASGAGSSSSFSPFPSSQVAPLSTNFTQEAFSSSAVYDKTARMVIATSKSGNAFLLSNIPLPSVPYTVDLAGSFDLPTSSGYEDLALFLINSSSGNLVYFSVGDRNGFLGYEVDYFSNYSSFSGAYFDINSPDTTPSYTALRITDDGTNRTFYASHNGLDYVQLFQQSSGFYISPTGVGLAVQSDGTLYPFTIYNYAVSASILPQFSN